MRKFILFLLMTVSAAACAWAITDGVKYEPVNDINIVNLWIQDRAHTQDLWASQPYCNTYARTAVMSDGYIYISRTRVPTRSSRVLSIRWMLPRATWSRNCP